MKTDNKGYSLIEVIIVIAIMAILAGLGMLTFNSVIRQRPIKAKNNLVTAAKYAQQLSGAQSKDSCMALIREPGTNGGYYAVFGESTGSTQADLQSNFKSEVMVGTTESGSSKKVKVNKTSSEGKTLTELINDPTIAQNYQAIGDRVSISYDGTEVTNDVGNCVIIKFSKFDGSTVAGSGRYEFKKKVNGDLVCAAQLLESTGKFKKTN